MNLEEMFEALDEFPLNSPGRIKGVECVRIFTEPHYQEVTYSLREPVGLYQDFGGGGYRLEVYQYGSILTLCNSFTRGGIRIFIKDYINTAEKLKRIFVPEDL